LARHGGGFKSDKRRKELLRLQKQEEKRQRRFSGKSDKELNAEETETGEAVIEESLGDESIPKDSEKNVE
jgi:hypothetical protein